MMTWLSISSAILLASACILAAIWLPLASIRALRDWKLERNKIN